MTHSEPETKSIRCELKHRIEAGSCTHCQERDQPLVVEVLLHQMSFRLCRSCAKALSSKLSGFLETHYHEEKPIVSRMSSTCAWLKDGTKIVIKRNKHGAAWLEVEDQAIIRAI